MLSPLLYIQTRTHYLSAYNGDFFNKFDSSNKIEQPTLLGMEQQLKQKMGMIDTLFLIRGRKADSSRCRY